MFIRNCSTILEMLQFSQATVQSWRLLWPYACEYPFFICMNIRYMNHFLTSVPCYFSVSRESAAEWISIVADNIVYRGFRWFIKNIDTGNILFSSSLVSDHSGRRNQIVRAVAGQFEFDVIPQTDIGKMPLWPWLASNSWSEMKFVAWYFLYDTLGIRLFYFEPQALT